MKRWRGKSVEAGEHTKHLGPAPAGHVEVFVEAQRLIRKKLIEAGAIPSKIMGREATFIAFDEFGDFVEPAPQVEPEPTVDPSEEEMRRLADFGRF